MIDLPNILSVIFVITGFLTFIYWCLNRITKEKMSIIDNKFIVIDEDLKELKTSHKDIKEAMSAIAIRMEAIKDHFISTSNDNAKEVMSMIKKLENEVEEIIKK